MKDNMIFELTLGSQITSWLLDFERLRISSAFRGGGGALCNIFACPVSANAISSSFVGVLKSPWK